MIRNIVTLGRQERGQVLALAAILALTLIAFVGLVVDAGFLYAQRRQAQNAADEAALAGAHALLEGSSQIEAEAAAFEYADRNGYDNVTDNTVTVNIPPLSGENAGDPDYIEVIVEEQPTSFFIHVVVPGRSTVQARGVATVGSYPAEYAIIVLDEHACEAYDQIGGAHLTINGGGVMVNSDCQPDAFSNSGSGDLLVDSPIHVHGGDQTGGSSITSPDPVTVPWTIDDPLADVVPPTLGAPAPGSTGTATNPDTWRVTTDVVLTLQPGTYYGGFYSNCTCTIYMAPGVYIMAGGGFTKAGGTTFVGNGVMIYVTENPTNATGDGAPMPFDLAGSGALDLSPATSGPYAGIALWQDASVTSDFRMRGSNDLAEGIFYVPGATMDLSGDADLGSVQLIVNDLYLHGNSFFTIDYVPFVTAEVPKAVLVE